MGQAARLLALILVTALCLGATHEGRQAGGLRQTADEAATRRAGPGRLQHFVALAHQT